MRRSGRDTLRYGAIQDDPSAIRSDSGARRFDTDDTSAIRSDSGEIRGPRVYAEVITEELDCPRGHQPARLARRGA